MNISIENKKISLLLFVAAVCTLTLLSAWAAAKGPVADFPGFTPIVADKVEGVAVDKVGNVYISVMETGDHHVVTWKYSPEFVL